MSYLEECYRHNIKLKPLEIIHSDKNVIKDNKIYCKKISHGLFMNLTNTEHYDIPIEKGLMLDISRGRVYKLEELKQMIVELACQGVDYIELYMEDLIPLEKYPMFGYQRGGYSADELKDLVSYANKFDIELIACVQALGHLENYLRWDEALAIKDTAEVINLDKKETYDFLEELFKTVKQIFGNKKIHVGMDEAFSMGLGQAFREKQSVNQKEMFQHHLQRIKEIGSKAGFLEIQIWSDMIFSINTGKDSTGLYDSDFEVKERISEEYKLFYWNYWAKDINVYNKMFQKHYEMSNNIGLAIGVHIWSELFYNKQLMNASINGIKSAKSNNVNDIMLTLWNDDGGICNWNTAKFGIFETMCELNEVKDRKQFYSKIYNENYTCMQEISKYALNSLEVINIFWDDPINLLYKKSLSNEIIKAALVELDSKTKFGINESYLIQQYNLTLEYLELTLLNYLNGYNSIESLIKEKEYYEELSYFIEKEWMFNSKFEGYEIIQSRMAFKIARYNFLISNFDNVDLISIIKNVPKTNYKLMDRHYPKIAYVNTNKM